MGILEVGTVRLPPYHDVMGLLVGLEGPHNQIRSAFRSMQLLSQALPICGSFPNHTSGVCLCRHFDRGVAGLTHHDYRLVGVCTQADTVKEFRKDVKIPLKPDGPG